MIKFFRKHSKTIIIITFLAFVLTIPVYYFGMKFGTKTTKTPPRSVSSSYKEIATVNGEPISYLRFSYLTNQKIKKYSRFGQSVGPINLLEIQYEILNDLVDFYLILQDAKKNKIVVDKKEVKENLEKIKFNQRIKNNRQLDLFLKREIGLSLKEYQKLIEEDLKVMKMTEKVKNEVIREEKESNDEYLVKQINAVEKYINNLRNIAKIEILNQHLLALKYIFGGKLEEAEKTYQKIIKDNPQDKYAHLFLGQIYERQNKNEQAFFEIKKSAELNETSEWRDPEIYINLAQIYLKLGKKQEAKTELDKAALIAGENLKIHEALFLAYNELGAKAEANKEKEEITRISEKIKAIIKAYLEKEVASSGIRAQKTESEKNKKSP